ncbi:MAG: hypothetical protein CYPHOPRED_002773 [Cyphobasidiales sp. Tagirdzhanova-0007]|nr:MAG: hypothetical protein CYPHOPRED_002773 [Cyphobasidiales sp. Tagirdzhanova-0007]
MGRTVYTPATISFLDAQAHSAASAPHSRGIDRHGVKEEDSKPGHSMPHLQPSATASSCKDAPWTWRQSSFDPDDESLPLVNERFIGSEEALHLQRGDQIHETGTSLQRLDGSMRGHEEGEHDVPTSAWYENERSINDEDDGDEEHTHVEDDREHEQSHGVRGYFDWQMDHPSSEGLPPFHQRLQPSRSDDFSPSAGVFHTHTLPFSLPAASEMQRRSPANNAVTVSSGTVIDGTPTIP